MQWNGLMDANSTKIDLRGEVALVTGGGRGLGRAFALALASAGASVGVVSRSEAQLDETVGLIQTRGGRAQAAVADVSDGRAVEQAVKRIEAALGPVSLLVNNAGVNAPLGPVWEADPDEWWRGMEINLRGPFLCARAVLPGMLARRQGRIINISSAIGLRVSAYDSAYAVSKCALARFTDNLATETAEHGICVFAISPGTNRTAMTQKMVESPEGQKWLPGFRKMYDEAPGDRQQRASELVLRLASGQADALSGCYLTLQDDLDEMVSRVNEIRRENLYVLTMNRL
jgi:NAD(P)-dependent dehydrogenase (short-subunit alcohol dehydrogenase family)